MNKLSLPLAVIAAFAVTTARAATSAAAVEGLGLAAAAELQPLAAAGDGLFRELELKYENGSLPTKGELTGWFAGRCYKEPRWSEPVGAMLAGVEKPDDAGNGPLFSPFRLTTVIINTNHNEYRPGYMVDYFDSPTPETRTHVAETVSALYDRATTAVETAGGLSSDQSGEMRTIVRRCDANRCGALAGTSGNLPNGSYFVAKNIALRPYYPTGSTGDVYAMCYFFKKTN
jgi:hypothetical protein